MYTANPSNSLVFAPSRSAARSIAGASAYTVLRVVVGVIMTAHGSQKLLDFDAWRGQVEALGIPYAGIAAPLAMIAELLGGLGLILGLLTPLSALGILATLVVAIATVHLEHGLFARDGGFELPLALAGAALCFFVNGGGPYSLDAALLRRGRRLRTREAPLGLPFDGAVPRPSGPLPSDGPIDEVTRSGMESFPASDPPAHSPRP